MQSDYTFLNDHSYSIRVDHDKIKTKKSRANSNRSSMKKEYRIFIFKIIFSYLIDKIKPNNRTVSIDRSSSDKENNLSSPTMNTSGNKTKTSTKKKTTNSRTQIGKKSN